MEDGKPTDPTKLSADEDDMDYEDEEDEEYVEDEEDLKAFTEALEKALPFERWRQLRKELEQQEAESRAEETKDVAQNG